MNGNGGWLDFELTLALYTVLVLLKCHRPVQPTTESFRVIWVAARLLQLA